MENRAEEEPLTDELMAKVFHLQEVTGVDDVEKCRNALEKNNWDYEAAASELLNADAHDNDDDRPATNRAAQTPPPVLQRRPVPPPIGAPIVRAGPMAWIVDIIDYFYNWTIVVFTTVWRFFRTLVIPGVPMIESNAADDVDSFIEEFETKYAGEHPVFYRGSFESAVRDAQRELKFLLVYLHGPRGQNTDTFCQEVLCSDAIREVTSGANLLFWACSTEKGEGYKVQRKLQSYTFPSVCFLTPSRQAVQLSFRFPQSALLTVADFITAFYGCIDANQASLEALRGEREQHQFNREIRAQQDAEFYESLRADQERERRAQEAVEEQREQDRKLLLKNQRKATALSALEQRKRDAANLLPPEPSDVSLAAGELCHIILKFPDGKRVERMFSPENSIQCIYYLALAQRGTAASFSVLTNFPRRRLRCSPSDESLTLRQAKLGRAEMLFIENDDDDSSSDSGGNSDASATASGANATASTSSAMHATTSRTAPVPESGGSPSTGDCGDAEMTTVDRQCL